MTEINKHKMTGVIVNSLESSQLNYLTIQQGNALVAHGHDFVVFYENLFPAFLKPNFAVMNTSEIWKFRGNLIATNLAHANQLIKVKNILKKYFYVYDLEWLRGHKNFVENIRTYRNTELTLACRSEEHAKIIENYCNRKPLIVENFDIPQLLNLHVNS